MAFDEKERINGGDGTMSRIKRIQRLKRRPEYFPDEAKSSGHGHVAHEVECGWISGDGRGRELAYKELEVIDGLQGGIAENKRSEDVCQEARLLSTKYKSEKRECKNGAEEAKETGGKRSKRKMS